MNKSQILDAVYKLASGELEDKRKFVPGVTRIPATFPDLHPSDVTSIVECALGYWYTENKWAHKFETRLKKITEREYGTLVNSGSSANLVAISSLITQYRDPRPYVLTCATAFPTTVAPIYQTGKLPYYVDIDPSTLAPDMTQVWEALDRDRDKICGAIFAHTLGFPFDEALMRQSLGEDQFLVADCCDALGARFITNEWVMPVGKLSDISTYSFFPAHHITSAEGGSVLTDRPDLAEIIQKLTNWGRSCYCRPGEQNTCGERFTWPDLGGLPLGWDHKYIFDELGYNLKMTDLQAALGYSQIVRLEGMNDRRNQNYVYLKKLLYGLSNELLFTAVPEYSIPSPFGFPISFPEYSRYSIRDFVAYLYQHKIETRRVFAGNITAQPGFMDLQYKQVGSLEGSDFVMNNTIWISCSPTLTEEMIEYMADVIYKFFGKELSNE